MKKLIIMLLCFGALQIQAQTVMFVTDSNSKELLKFQKETTKYNTFLKAKSKAGHSYDRERFNGKLNVWEYGGECFCEGVKFTLSNVDKPLKAVYLIPTTIKYIHDTIEKVIHDTVLLPIANSVVDTCLSDFNPVFSSVDSQTKFIKNDKLKTLIPYIEKIYYDQNNRPIYTQKLDPYTQNVLIE